MASEGEGEGEGDEEDTWDEAAVAMEEQGRDERQWEAAQLGSGLSSAFPVTAAPPGLT